MGDEYTVNYHPGPVRGSLHKLASSDDLVTAIRTACDMADSYYGSRSPIIVKRGNKRILEIPSQLARSL